jgi:hypothetical protein
MIVDMSLLAVRATLRVLIVVIGPLRVLWVQPLWCTFVGLGSVWEEESAPEAGGGVVGCMMLISLPNSLCLGCFLLGYFELMSMFPRGFEWASQMRVAYLLLWMRQGIFLWYSSAPPNPRAAPVRAHRMACLPMQCVTLVVNGGNNGLLWEVALARV